MTPTPKPTPISRSMVLAIRGCPRRAAYQYIIKLDPSTPHGGLVSPRVSPDLAIGSALHLVFEKLLVAPSTPLDELVGIAWAQVDIQRGIAQGFSRVDPVNHSPFIDHLKMLLTGLVWVARNYMVPSLLQSYTVEKVEHEFKPLIQMVKARNGQYYSIALQGRTDGIFRGDFDEPVIFSLKTAAVYSNSAYTMQDYDTQGLTESYLYWMEHGQEQWPAVQMGTLIKGQKIKKDGTATTAAG